jgi:outer membrane lipoprotein-sorting protein
MRSIRTLAVVALAAAAACAPKPPVLPSGTGTPFPEFEAAYAEATASCRDIRTFSAAMALSGRAGGTKLRGRIDAGFAAPDRARLEGVPPFGRPVFILVAGDGHGTLLLPRDQRVIRDAPPAQIVEALAGIPLGAADLRAAVTGCGLSVNGSAVRGRTYNDGWAAVDLDTGTAYLKHDTGAWRVAAATRESITLVYGGEQAGRPETVRLRATDGARTLADLTLRLSQVDVNVPLGDAVFRLEVPPDADPMTLDELRRAGPLGR